MIVVAIALVASLSSQVSAQVAAKVAPSVVRVSAIGAHRRESPMAAGTQAPELSARAVDVVTKSFAAPAAIALAGGKQPTVVNFWATWCGPCVHEMPELAKAAARLQGRVAFVGVATEDSPIDEIVAVARKAGVTYPLYRGSDAAWNVAGIPSTFIVDANGVVRWSGTGAMTAIELDVALTSVLGGAPELPGERVAAAGFAAKPDVVVTSRDVLQYDTDLVVVSSDGVAHDVLGALADDADSGVALLKIDVTKGALPPIALAAPATPSSAPTIAFGVRATTVDDAPIGAAIVDDGARLVGMKLERATVPVDRIRALVDATKSDAALQRVGPDVRRNLIVSGVVFGAIAIAFVVAFVVARVRKRAHTKQQRGWTTTH